MILSKLKEITKSPYRAENLFSLFVVLFLLIAIPLTVLEVNSSLETRSQAANQTSGNPILVITSPTNGAVVSGSVQVGIEAQEPGFTVKIAKVIVDGHLTGSINNSSGILNGQVTWDTRKETNGTKTLEVDALSTDGTWSRREINVNVSNVDQVNPTVSFANLNEGSYISGPVFIVGLGASDNNGIKDIIVKLDGAEVGDLVSAPYNFDLNLTNVSPGSHTLSATAFDFVGNQATSKVTIYRGLAGISN